MEKEENFDKHILKGISVTCLNLNEDVALVFVL